MGPKSKKIVKRKPVSVADVPVNGIEPIDETAIEVPLLTEQRMYALNDAIDNRISDVERSRFSFNPKEMVASKSSKQQKPLGVPPREEIQLKLMAYYKVVHGNGLRVHEELSRNLSTNIANVVYVENHLAMSSPELQELAKAADLPAVCVLLLFLFTCEPHDIERLFVKDARSPLNGSPAATPTETNKLALMKLVNKLRQEKFSSDDENRSLQPSLLFKEILRGLNTKDQMVLAPWIGVICLLCSTFNVIADRIKFSGETFVDDQPTEPQPVKSKVPLPTTIVRSPPPDDSDDAQPKTRHVKLFFTMQFSSCEEALNAISKMSDTEQCVNIPLLQPMGTKPPSGVFELKRPEGFTEPNFDIDDNGDPRTFAEKVQLLCNDWYHPSDVLEQEETEEQPAVAGVRNPVEVTFEIQARPSSVVSLAPFSCAPTEEEHIISGFPVAKLHSVDAQHLVVVLREVEVPPDSVTEQATMFFTHALADARKASATAKRISTRLVQQFVKPHHCHRHPTQLYSHFCDTCRVFICPACCKETHLPHQKTPIAAFCVDESVRLQPKKNVLLNRLEQLKKLRDSIDIERGKMKEVVNTGVNDVLNRLEERQKELHEDADERASEQKKELLREQKNVEYDSGKIQQAKNVIAETKKGKVSPVPRVKLHERWQVNNKLVLKLPTEHMKKLVKLLTWSNPSKYLTHLVYPPPNEEKK